MHLFQRARLSTGSLAAAWALAVALPLVSLGACRGEQDGSADSNTGQAASQEDEPVPTRADDMVRDAGEKPQEVLDELGVGPGSKVADVIAGGGYYTYLLAERVGPDGMIYATQAKVLGRRLAEGDLAGKTNVKVVETLAEVPPGTLDAVLINRAYHLIPHPETTFFPALRTALKPGGKVAVIEVRLGKPNGHDMKTHRMGQETVREEMEKGGFTFVGASEMLANPADPRTGFMEGKRYLADRMFLMFEKAAETARTR